MYVFQQNWKTKPKADDKTKLNDLRNKLKSEYFKKPEDKDEDEYRRGVAAHGVAEILDPNDLPQNDFFIPGRTFEIRARHSDLPGKLITSAIVQFVT